jgi:hypothetical protein
MASFTDTQPLHFNPFTNTKPVDTYTAVAMQKQMQYNQGVDKVQAYLDNVSGIKVVRPQDKQYIDNKLNEITSKVNSIASADWSNQAIVKQIGSQAAGLYNDGNVQAAMLGTAKYYKDEASIEEAKKNGKWAPENEWMIRRQMQQWLQDPSAGAPYNTGGYKNFEDVTADIMKQWKDAKPNSTLVQRPNGDFYAYETVDNQTVGKDGRTLIETTTKELRPDEIRNQIDALLTGSQREQLAITGAYNGRGLDVNGLANSIDTHYKQTDDYYANLINQAQHNKTLAANPDQVAKFDADILDLTNQRAAQEKEKGALKSQALSNPDAVKSAMYYENWLNNISKTMGYTDTSSKIIENPAYKAQLDEAKLWLDLQKTQMADARMRDIAAMRKGAKGKTTIDEQGNITFEPDSYNVLPTTEEERKGVTITDFKDKLLALNQVSQDQMNELLWRKTENGGESDLINKTATDLNQDGIIDYTYHIKPGKEAQAQGYIADYWDKYKRGELNDPMISQALSAQDESKLVANKLAKDIQTLEKKADDLVRSDPKYGAYKISKDAYDKMGAVQIGNERIGPSEVEKYYKLSGSLKGGGGAAGVGANTAPTDEELKRAGLTFNQFYAIRGSIDGNIGHRNNDQQDYISTLHGAMAQMHSSYEPLKAKRENYINEQARRYQGIFNQTANNISAEKGPEINRVTKFVQSLAGTAKQSGQVGSTDWAAVRDMIGKKNSDNTTYAYVQDRDGNIKIRVTNVDVNKGKPEEITVDRQTAAQFYTPDYLGTARSLLDLGEGIRTGSTFEEAVPLNNQRTGRYNVRYEVQNYKGNYQVKLYASDKQDPSISAKELPISRGMFPDWDSLSAFLSTDVNEAFIRSLMGGAPQSQPSGNSGMFQGNSIINQMQSQIPAQ